MDVGFYSLHMIVVGYSPRFGAWKGWRALLDDLANEENQ